MDSVFRALADPSRRALLDALRARDGQTLSELEARLEMSRFGVAKHLKVLDAAGLVTRVRRGRFTHHYLNAAALAEALGRWIEPYEVAPAVGAMLGLKARLEGRMDDAAGGATRPDYVLSTYIRCGKDALWQALTDPAANERWDFLSMRAAREGDVVTYSADGAPMVRARDLEAVPGRRLVTTFEPLWEKGAPSSRVTYEIEEEGGYCRLTLTHDGLPEDQRAGAVMGWERSFAGLKTYLETGAPANFGGPHLFAEEDAT